MNKEIGEELSLKDLTDLTKPCVVVTRREDRSFYITAWLVAMNLQLAHFVTRPNTRREIHFFAAVQPNGTLADDTGKQIHVYKYLGEV